MPMSVPDERIHLRWENWLMHQSLVVTWLLTCIPVQLTKGAPYWHRILETRRRNMQWIRGMYRPFERRTRIAPSSPDTASRHSQTSNRNQSTFEVQPKRFPIFFFRRWEIRRRISLSLFVLLVPR
jgi:hypothetical protein